MEQKTVIVIGSAGQVGDGIKKAFAAQKWNVIAIDPKEDELASLCNVKSIRSTAEEVTERNWKSWFLDCVCCEVVYASEEGNRDVYDLNPDLGTKNNHRFATHLERLKRIFLQVRTSTAQRLYISYCGGSWTRRKMDSQTFCVGDESATKNNGGENNYECAKSSACEYAKSLARMHKDWLTILFFDYISVVPNYSANFTMRKMVQSAMTAGKIAHSAGDYGRPLLNSQQAGSILVTLAEQRASLERLNHKDPFDIFIVPGHFTSFETFAKIAKEIAEQNGKKNVKLICQEDTPDFLRSRCYSERLVETIDFVADYKLVEKGLRETAERAILEYI